MRTYPEKLRWIAAELENAETVDKYNEMVKCLIDLATRIETVISKDEM